MSKCIFSGSAWLRENIFRKGYFVHIWNDFADYCHNIAGSEQRLRWCRLLFETLIRVVINSIHLTRFYAFPITWTVDFIIVIFQ